MEIAVCDETGLGFGWIHPKPRWMERASHALVAGGRVWIVDPTEGDGVDERIRALGEPAGVIRLLDRHNRDCAAFAKRLGVPLYRVGAGVGSGLALVGPGGLMEDLTPFEAISVVNVPRWHEVALWWPEEGVLVCADALGTAPYYLARGERLATSPVLRLTPPKALRGLEPRQILCGHGKGIVGDEAPLLLEEALTTARRRSPSWLASYLRMVIGR